MGSFEDNGSHDLRMTGSELGPVEPTPAVEHVPANGDGRVAPTAQVAGRPLDPSSIGRLVEQEVATMLGAAAAEADRISSTAMVVVRKAEAKIAALQLELDGAIAELRELAHRAEATTEPMDPPGAVEPRNVPEPSPSAERSTPEPALSSAPPAETGLPAVLTEPPAAMQRAADPERASLLDMPTSNDVVRLLREHLS